MFVAICFSNLLQQVCFAIIVKILFQPPSSHRTVWASIHTFLTCVICQRDAGEHAIFLLCTQPVHLVHEHCLHRVAVALCSHPCWIINKQPAGVIWPPPLSATLCSTWALYSQPGTRPKLKSYSTSPNADGHCCCNLVPVAPCLQSPVTVYECKHMHMNTHIYMHLWIHQHAPIYVTWTSRYSSQREDQEVRR